MWRKVRTVTLPRLHAIGMPPTVRPQSQPMASKPLYTLVAVAGMLREAGAASIEVAVTHALFGEDLRRRLETVGVRRLVSTDSVVRGEDAAPLAGILAEALRRT